MLLTRHVARRSSVVELYRLRARTTDDILLIRAGAIPLRGNASAPIDICFDRYTVCRWSERWS